ncbi:P-type ATPase [Gigaspora rosea]|uniref:P-type ATPase n=1 Tax=Gigaspora rosea TaxID=44941 RepID=A0A397V431_9GLOM|nr:P-type ATPase [Gigaspora rosea]
MTGSVYNWSQFGRGEGLPIVVAVIWVWVFYEWLKKNAIIKKLPSVEIWFCTLTENVMTITKMFTLDEENTFDLGHDLPSKTNIASEKFLKLEEFVTMHILMKMEKIWQATHVALLDCLIKMNMEYEIMVSYFSEIPFSSDQKWMSVNCRRKNDNSSKEIRYLKGSIEFVLGKCTSYFVSETHKPLLDVPAKESVM